MKKDPFPKGEGLAAKKEGKKRVSTNNNLRKGKKEEHCIVLKEGKGGHEKERRGGLPPSEGEGKMLRKRVDGGTNGGPILWRETHIGGGGVYARI